MRSSMELSSEINGLLVKEVEVGSDAELKGIFEGIHDTLKGGFGTAMAADKKQGGIIAGLLGGLGSGLGTLGEGVAKLGIGFSKGLIALGAGIAGFMLALGATDVILGLMGACAQEDSFLY